MRIRCEKAITAAEEGKPQDPMEILDEKCDILEDDFDYVLAGIDKLCRDGSYSIANDIIEAISSAVNDAISQIGDVVSEE